MAMIAPTADVAIKRTAFATKKMTTTAAAMRLAHRMQNGTTANGPLPPIRCGTAQLSSRKLWKNRRMNTGARLPPKVAWTAPTLGAARTLVQLVSGKTNTGLRATLLAKPT